MFAYRKSQEGSLLALMRVAAYLTMLCGITASNETIYEDLKPNSTLTNNYEAHKRNLTNISWSNGVNSRQRLIDALNGPSMMLEADVVLGYLDRTPHLLPVMASPPVRVTDLSFDEFLNSVMKHNKEKKSKRKGIKLDFKRFESVQPVLKKLQEKKNGIDFPVWLHGDVLRGPVDAIRTPLDGRKFLNLTRHYFPQGTLSLGWTTRFGWDDAKFESKREKIANISRGQYNHQQINAMIKLWSEFSENKSDKAEPPPPLTFSVRAAIATQSVDMLLILLAKIGPQSSLTLWASENDAVNTTDIDHFIETVGYDKVYCELPDANFDEKRSNLKNYLY